MGSRRIWAVDEADSLSEMLPGRCSAPNTVKSDANPDMDMNTNIRRKHPVLFMVQNYNAAMHRAGLLFLITVLLPFSVHAQVDDGKAAIDRGELVRAVNILSEEVVERPSADAFLYLGMAYGRMREFVRAEEVLRQGAERYPGDPR